MICNQTWHSGVFPNECKLAKVSVIPQRDIIQIMVNLLPISILSILGKILEAKKELVLYMENNNLF